MNGNNISFDNVFTTRRSLHGGRNYKIVKDLLSLHRYLSGQRYGNDNDFIICNSVHKKVTGINIQFPDSRLYGT